MTGDTKLKPNEIEKQEEYVESLIQARELLPVEESSIKDIDLDQLNSYIQEINRPVKVETIKADIRSAMFFLEFRVQLNAYIDVPNTVAGDKQDYSGSVLSLMENGFSYVTRNTYRGTSSQDGGTGIPQYPEQLLRETVNEVLEATEMMETVHIADPEFFVSLNDDVAKPVVNALYRFNHFSSSRYPNARQVAHYLWAAKEKNSAVKEFDDFNRRVRYFIEKTRNSGIIEKVEKGCKIAETLPKGLLI